MRTQHTPGPWSIGRANPESGQTFVNIMSFGSRVGTVIHGGAEKGEANARLIAAAPDLLAACELAIAQADRARANGGPVKDNGEFLAAARAAVALTKEEVKLETTNERQCLDAIAEHLADLCCRAINREAVLVPPDLTDPIKYRCQHTLETLIDKLQARV